MCGWIAAELADHTQGLRSAGQISQVQKEQGNRAPHLLQDCPGGCRSAPRRSPGKEGLMDRFFQRQPWPCRVIPSN